MPVVLDDREEGVNGIVNLAAGSGSNLIVCQGVMFFCVLGDAGNKEAFVKFGDSTTEVDASIGGRVQSVFFLPFRVLPFMDGLEKTLLPGLRVGVVQPEGIEEL